MLDLAREVQGTAREDDWDVSALTEEQKEKLQRVELDKQVMAADERYWKMMDGEAEDEDDDEDDGEMSNVAEEDEVHEEEESAVEAQDSQNDV
jgi:hypothetical protein